MKRYKLTFKVFKTKEEAEHFAAEENATGTYYKRRHRRASVSLSGPYWGNLPIVWYYY